MQGVVFSRGGDLETKRNETSGGEGSSRMNEHGEHAIIWRTYGGRGACWMFPVVGDPQEDQLALTFLLPVRLVVKSQNQATTNLTFQKYLSG